MKLTKVCSFIFELSSEECKDLHSEICRVTQYMETDEDNKLLTMLSKLHDEIEIELK